MSVKMNMNEKVMDKTVNAENTMSFTYVFEVMSDSAGWKTLLSTITKFGMDVNSMGHTMHFDTGGTGDTIGPMGMMSKVFGAMTGAEFYFTVNDNGEIGKLSGIREMFDKMFAGFPNSEEMAQNLKGGFDEESIRQNMQQAFAAYPGKTVKPGESWSKMVVQQTQGMRVNFENHFTLESVVGDDAVIKVNSKLSSPDTNTVNGTQMNMSGTSDGKLHYNLKTGMPTDGDQQMSMNLKVSSNGMEIPIGIDVKTTTKGRQM
jgi:hypothetical protein